MTTIDPYESAQAAGLRYTSDTQAGIRRQRRGKGFRYIDVDGTSIRDSRVLHRIKTLVIPPAWTDVWICSHPNGHLQATGRDTKGRKQYRYHPHWRTVRDATKYDRLIAFGETLSLGGVWRPTVNCAAPSCPRRVNRESRHLRRAPRRRTGVGRGCSSGCVLSLWASVRFAIGERGGSLPRFPRGK